MLGSTYKSGLSKLVCFVLSAQLMALVCWGEEVGKSQRSLAETTGHLISDLTCALPSEAWTDADSNVHKPIASPPAGLWRIIDYTSER